MVKNKIIKKLCNQVKITLHIMKNTIKNNSKEISKMQFSTDGKLKHLLTLKGISKTLLTNLLNKSETYLSPDGNNPINSDELHGTTIANLFFEPSTRTWASFELAAKRLGGQTVNLNIDQSSKRKGETVLDTINNHHAMQIDVFVIRHSDEKVIPRIVEQVDNNISIINAGSANISHPTQGLLDLLTIRQYKGSFENLVVAIVGDIKHSRVARSAIEGLSILGVGELRLIAPKEMTFESKNTPNIKIFHNLDEGIKNSDVIMSLRIQKERISNLKNVPNIDEYIKHYRINQKRIMTASPDVIIMHPGPVNRDIEIESSIVDGPHSVITKQVTNGVAVRMAILSTMIKN